MQAACARDTDGVKFLPPAGRPGRFPGRPLQGPGCTQIYLMTDDFLPSVPAAADWTVLCDFDGTISLRDVTDSLLERFGRPGWRELEQAWERGEIGSRECM